VTEAQHRADLLHQGADVAVLGAQVAGGPPFRRRKLGERDFGDVAPEDESRTASARTSPRKPEKPLSGGSGIGTAKQETTPPDKN
jgi:hypothetical protein